MTQAEKKKLEEEYFELLCEMLHAAQKLEVIRQKLLQQ